MIIIPDIHGRTFWKDAVKKRGEKEKVIFLGDYVDPYPRENISSIQVIENLKEILKFKEENPREVIMLAGNHDLTYILSSHRSLRCRYDYLNEGVISDLLLKIDPLLISWYETFGNITYLFSHSGYHPKWLKENFDPNISIEEVSETANGLFKERDPEFMNALSDCSWEYRGGDSDFGSIVWADLREHGRGESIGDGVFQIFGHTQLIEDPVIQEHHACLDCRCAFRLDEKSRELLKL